MEHTSQQKGKGAEFLVFGELIRRGVDLYIPIVDIGIDALVRRNNGTFSEIQIKSTEAEEQAGYFNVDDLDNHPQDKFFIICVDMNEENYLEKGKPNIWVIPVKDYKNYMTASGRLPIYETRRGDNKPRYILLQDYYYAWEKLTA